MTRLVSWNMNDRRLSPSKWQYLRDLGADVALVQEAVIPSNLDAVHGPSGIAGRDGKARPWGSAVVVLN